MLKTDFIEPAAVAVLRIHGEVAAQQPHAVAVVDVAAILAVIAADRGEAVAQFPRLRDVVVARVLAARRADVSPVVGATVSCADERVQRVSRKADFSACASSSQERRIAVRSVNAHVAQRALLIFRIEHVV